MAIMPRMPSRPKWQSSIRSSTFTRGPSAALWSEAELTGRSQSNFAHQFTDYVFNVGYLQQRWADVQLTFFNDALKLHRGKSVVSHCRRLCSLVLLH